MEIAKYRSYSGSMSCLFWCLALLVFPPSILVAAPGSPDAAFGLLGQKIDDHATYYMNGNVVAQLPDGKLLVAGKFDTGGNAQSADWRLLLRRYNINGSVDTSFGVSGFAVHVKVPVVTTYVSGEATELLIQADGKILVAGYGPNGTTLWRFTSVGELDPSFAGDGSLSLQRNASIPIRILEQQGKYLVFLRNSPQQSSRLLRLHSTGLLDLQFGVSGQAMLAISSSELPIAINSSNGKIVVGGSQNSIPALQHFNANGTFDTTFGANGVRIVPLSVDCGEYTMTPRWFSSMILQMDGDLIGGLGVDYLGGCDDPACYGNAIVRLNPDDTLDGTYGSGGFAVKCDGRHNGPRLKAIPNGTNQILTRLSQPIVGSAPRLRRFAASGFQSLVLPEATVIDFLAQTDGKILTMNSANGDIRLSRYLP